MKQKVLKIFFFQPDKRMVKREEGSNKIMTFFYFLVENILVKCNINKNVLFSAVKQ